MSLRKSPTFDYPENYPVLNLLGDLYLYLYFLVPAGYLVFILFLWRQPTSRARSSAVIALMAGVPAMFAFSICAWLREAFAGHYTSPVSPVVGALPLLAAAAVYLGTKVLGGPAPTAELSPASKRLRRWIVGVPVAALVLALIALVFLFGSPSLR